MKFYDSLFYSKYEQYLYSLFKFKYEYYRWSFMKKEKKKKPLIGFEPMTYALPWRYSTAELKGPRLVQFPNKELATMSLVYIFITAYTYYI